MIYLHIVNRNKMLAEGIEKAVRESDLKDNIKVKASYTLAECRNALRDTRKTLLQFPNHSAIILLDLSMPDGSGMDFCSEVNKKASDIAITGEGKENPKIRVIALTSYNHSDTIIYMLNKKASGFIITTAYLKEVIAGIRKVEEGETYLCDRSKAILTKDKWENYVWATYREQELLTLIAEDITNMEIAEKMGIHEDTVKKYRQKLFIKFGAKRTTDLLKIATQKGLIWMDIIP